MFPSYRNQSVEIFFPKFLEHALNSMKMVKTNIACHILPGRPQAPIFQKWEKLNLWDLHSTF